MEQSLIFWGSKDTIYKVNLWDSILFFRRIIAKVNDITLKLLSKTIDFVFLECYYRFVSKWYQLQKMKR